MVPILSSQLDHHQLCVEFVDWLLDSEPGLNKSRWECIIEWLTIADRALLELARIKELPYDAGDEMQVDLREWMRRFYDN